MGFGNSKTPLHVLHVSDLQISFSEMIIKFSKHI